VRKEKIQLGKLEESVLDYTYDLTVDKVEDLKDGRTRYDAFLNLGVKNSSQIGDVEVSGLVIEIFEGQFSSEAATADAQIMEISAPPDIFHRPIKTDLIWKKLRTTGYAYPGALLSIGQYLGPLRINLQSGGSLIGRWARGQTYDATYHYLVTSSSKFVLGACINVITNRGKDPRDFTYLVVSRPLWKVE
jgi:hypothetical protein